MFDLPRFLRLDEEWMETGVYFAGQGLVGAADYYPGERVIDDNGVGVPTIYRVLNGFGDGSTPSSFYRPNEQAPFYEQDAELVYQDTLDIVGVHPRDLIFNAPYGTTPGDRGTGMAITANEARWEDLGPASTNQWLQADFNAMFIAALRANPTFAQFFRVDNDPDIPGNLIIEAGGSSGVSGYPSFRGLLIEFAFPDIIANLTDETNGGTIGVIPTPSGGTAVSAGGAVMFEAVTRERAYVPFDSASPSTTEGTPLR